MDAHVHHGPSHRRTARAAEPDRRLRARDARAHGLDLDPGSTHDASRARRALQPSRAARARDRARRRRELRHQDPRLPGRHGGLRARDDARPPGQVHREPARVVPVRHPRARADDPRRGRGRRRRRPDRDAGLDHRRGRALLRLSPFERGRGRPGASTPAGALSPATLRRGPARRGAEQGRHLAISRGRTSDRHRRDGEHDRSRRARSRTRSSRGAPPTQSRAPRGASVHLGDRQRLRQWQLPGRAGTASRGCGLRPAAARAEGGPRRRALRGTRALVLRRADRPGRAVLRRRRRADLGPGGNDLEARARGRDHGPRRRHQPGSGNSHGARADHRRRARRRPRRRLRAVRGHGGGAVRRRHLGQSRHADRRRRDLARGARARGAHPVGRRGAPGGGRRRHPARRGPRRGPWKPGARSELLGDRARRTLPIERAPRRRAEPRSDRALHESGRVDLHQRCAPRRGRGRRRDRPGARLALRRRR